MMKSLIMEIKGSSAFSNLTEHKYGLAEIMFLTQTHPEHLNLTDLSYIWL